MHVGSSRQCWREASDCCNRSGIFTPIGSEGGTDEAAERSVLTTTRVPSANSLSFPRVLSETTEISGRLTMRAMCMMRATRYGCDLAGVLQTHPDLGPAWPLTNGPSAAFQAATTRVCVRVWHGFRPCPTRFAARYVGRDADA